MTRQAIALALALLLLAPVLRAQTPPPDAVRAILTLRAPVTLTSTPTERRAAVAQTADGLQAALDRADAVVLRRLAQVPALVIQAEPAALEALSAHPNVLSVQLDEPGGGHADESRPALGADTVHADYGLTGLGVRVAVLDSGYALAHPDVAPAVVAEACFTGGGVAGAGSCPPGDTLTGASAQDENGHGTNVTGVITSDGLTAPRGFAPDSAIVAVRVLDAFNSGWLSDWVVALDWIIDNQEALRVDVINMSLGSFALYPPGCEADQPALASAVALLRSYWGVPVFASSGNNGDPYLMAAPACLTEVIAVGASYDSDMGREPDSGTWRTRFGSGWPTCFDSPTGLGRLACFSNGGSGVDLVAPGVYITSAGLTSPTSRYAGTSQAAPTAAGVAALLLQARPALSPDQLEALLETTGVPLADVRGNGFTYPRIDALAAVQAALATLPAPALLAPIDRAAAPAEAVLSWAPVPQAEAYYLWLSRADGPKVYNVWLNPAEWCSAEVCRFTSYFPLSPGVYRWWVQAWEPVLGESAWAGAALFTVE